MTVGERPKEVGQCILSQFPAPPEFHAQFLPPMHFLQED